MNHTVIINIMIAILVGIALIITREPVTLLGLLLLHELPYGLEQAKLQIEAKLLEDDDDGDDADGRGIGFTANV